MIASAGMQDKNDQAEMIVSRQIIEFRSSNNMSRSNSSQKSFTSSMLRDSNEGIIGKDL